MKQVHLPVISKLSKEYKIEVVTVVDKSSDFDNINGDLHNFGIYGLISTIKVEDNGFFESYKMSANFKIKLDSIVLNNYINGVIISIDPLYQYAYIEWAIKRGLNVFADKPLTFIPYMNKNKDHFTKLFLDAKYLYGLSNTYRDYQTNNKLIIMVFTQRRFQKCYEEILKQVQRVSTKTTYPISYLHMLHNDGQYHKPEEYFKSGVHSFLNGRGKLAHTGYHVVDIAMRTVLSSYSQLESIDKIEVECQVTKPRDLINLYNNTDTCKYFRPCNEIKYDENILETMGEVDVFVTIRIICKSSITSTIRLDMLHSGYSERYEQNKQFNNYVNPFGRVKHESLKLYQGPFQYIHLEKRRGRKELINTSQYLSELHIVRNCSILDNLEECSVNKKFYEYENGLQKDRVECIEAFIKGIKNNADDYLKSSLESHLISIQIYAAIYNSIITERKVIIKDLVNKYD